MSLVESIPLLVVVLLLISVGGGEIEQLGLSFAGEHAIEELEDAEVVAGGTTTIPADEIVTGDVYVIGGTVRVEGQIEGDVTIVAGNLSVIDGGTVTGTVQRYGGEAMVAEGATVGQFSEFDAPTPNNSLEQRFLAFLLQFLALGSIGFWLVRRHSGVLDNVGDAITGHTLVSGVVGALAAVTLLVLFVYMAFTLILIPVTIVGLLGEVLIVLYGQVALGHLIGRRLPIARTDLATVAGVGTLLLVIEGLGFVPYLGALIQLSLIVVGFGAVVNTYFGLARFEPPTIAGAGR